MMCSELRPGSVVFAADLLRKDEHACRLGAGHDGLDLCWYRLRMLSLLHLCIMYCCSDAAGARRGPQRNVLFESALS